MQFAYGRWYCFSSLQCLPRFPADGDFCSIEPLSSCESWHTSTFAVVCLHRVLMFTLLYGFFEYLFRKDEFHILILGVDKAGKTNVLERLKTIYSNVIGLDPGKILPTVGLNVGRVEAHNTSLVFWDLGGQVGLRSIWEKYYEESHAVIYVVDSANKGRFDESKSAMEKVLGSRELYGAPLLILANKQDLEEAETPQSVAEHFGIGRVDSRPVKVQPVCAYTGQGLREGVQWLVEVIKRSPRVARLRAKHAGS